MEECDVSAATSSWGTELASFFFPTFLLPATLLGTMPGEVTAGARWPVGSRRWKLWAHSGAFGREGPRFEPWSCAGACAWAPQGLSRPIGMAAGQGGALCPRTSERAATSQLAICFP